MVQINLVNLWYIAFVSGGGGGSLLVLSQKTQNEKNTPTQITFSNKFNLFPLQSWIVSSFIHIFTSFTLK